MSENTKNIQNDIWRRLVTAHKEYALLINSFLSQEIDRISVLKTALNSKDRVVAIFILPYLKSSELQSLFSDLVLFASYTHSDTKRFRDLILSLPKEWVLNNIEKEIQKIIANGSDDEYRRVLELLINLDKNLTTNLIEKALQNPDSEIREVGEEFLGKLREL